MQRRNKAKDEGYARSLMTRKEPVITIDGASGTGKGVVTHLVAKRLSWNLLDSGALYRVLALAAQQHIILMEDELALSMQADNLNEQFVKSEVGEHPKILLENQNVTDIIRTEKIVNAASKIVHCQMCVPHYWNVNALFAQPLVSDGWPDMGTVVFPDADVKIFLLASRKYERAGALTS